MVQNEIGTEAFRQARPLAEGKKSGDGKHDWGIATPPSANQDSWRKGSDFPGKTQTFGFLRHHLAEGVRFPEKNAGSPVFQAVIWRRGSSVRKRHSILAILNHASPAKGPGLNHDF